MQFVDANIFIRHLTADDPDKARACLALFQRANRNELALTTSESVIAEVVYVLSSKQLYGLSHEEIKTLLYPLITIPGLKLTHRKTYLRALDLYAAYPLDFEDALSVAHLERQGITDLISYDRGFDRVANTSNIARMEP